LHFSLLLLLLLNRD